MQTTTIGRQRHLHFTRGVRLKAFDSPFISIRQFCRFRRVIRSFSKGFFGGVFLSGWSLLLRCLHRGHQGAHCKPCAQFLNFRQITIITTGVTIQTPSRLLLQAEFRLFGSALYQGFARLQEFSSEAEPLHLLLTSGRLRNRSRKGKTSAFFFSMRIRVPVLHKRLSKPCCWSFWSCLHPIFQML